MSGYEAKRAILGTYGSMYLEGELVRETTALKADAKMQFLDVKMCGVNTRRKKFSGLECNGSVTMTKTNSRMAKLLSDYIKEGKTPEFTIISKLKDPDAWGAERVVLKGVQFSNLEIANWSVEQLGETTYNFTFTDWDFMDLIEEK